MKPTILALNGFMGKAADWKIAGLDHILKPWSLDSESKGLDDWAHKLSQHADSLEEKPYLLGYSFGSRIALHSLINSPNTWSGAVIVSAHPGLTTQELKDKRIEEDSHWAKKILNDPWDEFMTDWNSRSVLTDGFEFQRRESDYNRKELAMQLLSGSLGHQKDLRLAISQLSIPILWIVGEKDATYCTLADSLTFKHSHSKLIKFPQSGHRVLWDQPTLSHSAIIDFCR